MSNRPSSFPVHKFEMSVQKIKENILCTNEDRWSKTMREENVQLEKLTGVNIELKHEKTGTMGATHMGGAGHSERYLHGLAHIIYGVFSSLERVGPVVAWLRPWTADHMVLGSNPGEVRLFSFFILEPSISLFYFFYFCACTYNTAVLT